VTVVEYKVSSGARAVKDGGADSGTAEFVIASLGVVDADNDIVVPGAIGTQTVPLLPAHDWSSIPLGKATTAEIGGLVVANARFNLDIAAGREWHRAILFDLEHGPSTQQYSWGYSVLSSSPGKVGGKDVRFLHSVRLHEVSPVVRGASVGTRTLTAKGTFEPGELAAISRAVREEQAEQLQREWLRFVKMQLMSCRTDSAPATDDGVEPVSERAIPEGRRNLAAGAAKIAAAHLGIPTPSIFWFRPKRGSRGAPLGLAYRGYDGEIHLNEKLSDARLAEIVAHEVAHAAGADEPAAQKFEKRFLKEVVK